VVARKTGSGLRPYVWSIALHGLIAAIAVGAWQFTRSPAPPQTLAIEATVVDAKNLPAAPQTRERPAKPEPAPPPQAPAPEPEVDRAAEEAERQEREAKLVAERERQERQERERQEQERQRVEQQRLAAEEAAKKAAEEKRIADEQAAAKKAARGRASPQPRSRGTSECHAHERRGERVVCADQGAHRARVDSTAFGASRRVVRCVCNASARRRSG
jgi:colicin import membrane protein